MEPEYEITYKQLMTAEDIFLHSGNKNDATFRCKIMIVSTIKLVIKSIKFNTLKIILKD